MATRESERCGQGDRMGGAPPGKPLLQGVHAARQHFEAAQQHKGAPGIHRPRSLAPTVLLPAPRPRRYEPRQRLSAAAALAHPWFGVVTPTAVISSTVASLGKVVSTVSGVWSTRLAALIVVVTSPRLSPPWARWSAL